MAARPVGRDELVPARLAVAALTTGDRDGEIFDMDLNPGPVVAERIQAHALFLDDLDGLVAVRGR